MSMALGMIPSLADMLDDASSELSHLDASLLSDRLSGLVTLSLCAGKAIAAPISGALAGIMNYQDAYAVFGFTLLAYSVIYGIYGNGFKALAGYKSYKARSDILLGEKEMVESRKSFYLLEEDEV